jgi:hypothetical protein
MNKTPNTTPETISTNERSPLTGTERDKLIKAAHK